jgi:hypothetical protein
VTTTWDVVRRAEDGEHVGYLAPTSGDASLAVPMTLAGTPAAGPLPAGEAADLLVGSGLALLARRWWCRLPNTMASRLTDAAAPGADWPWRPVVLVEVSPREVQVRPEWPAAEEGAAVAVLPVPAGELLRHTPPAG